MGTDENMPTYHRDVFLPKRIRGMVPSGTKELFYSEHAKLAAENDRYGDIILPSHINMLKVEIVEVEVYEFAEKENQYTLRFSYNHKYDLTLIVMRGNSSREFFVKTLWLNEKSDDGKGRRITFAKHRYVTNKR